jgi:hypothetical protein
VVARVTPRGSGKLFRLDLNCDPQWIAPGAGALWVTCYNLDEIEYVTTSGAVTRIPVPSHIRGYPDVLSGIVRGDRPDRPRRDEVGGEAARPTRCAGLAR